MVTCCGTTIQISVFHGHYDQDLDPVDNNTADIEKYQVTLIRSNKISHTDTLSLELYHIY